MGMFDYILYKGVLPFNKKQAKMFDHINWTEEGFQTKDLENILSTYIINKNGSLVIRIIKGDHVERPKPKGHKGFWFPYEFVEKSRSTKKINHTGAVYFYHIVKDKKGNEWWVEFVSTFLKGKMLEVKLFKIELFNTFEEIEKKNQEIKTMMENDAKLFSTRFRLLMNKITFGNWTLFGRFVVRPFFQNLSSFFSKIASLSWKYF